MAWVPLGPACIPNGQLGYDSMGRGPVAGRVTCLALKPDDPDNTIYVGTANGGVWRSTDIGKTWTPLMDDKLSMSIGAMRSIHLIPIPTSRPAGTAPVRRSSATVLHSNTAPTRSAALQGPLQKMRCSQWR